MSHPLRRALGSMAALAATVLAVPATSPAFAPQTSALAQEIVVAGMDRPVRIEFETTMADPRIAGFAARVGGRWSVDWNEASGTPHMLLGSGPAFTVAILSADIAEAAARDVLAGSPDLVGAAPADLRLFRVSQGMGKWSAIFQQTVNGVQVEGAFVRVFFTEGGRLIALGSDAWPQAAGAAVVPAISRERAADIAASAVGYDGPGDRLDGIDLVILPVDDDAGRRFPLAWRVEFYVDNPIGRWIQYVDAATGAILGRRNLMHTAAVSGTADANVQFTGYCDGTTNGLPVRDMTVSITGQGSDVTDAAGAWDVTVPVGGPYTATAQLLGPFCNVNVYGAPPDASFSGGVSIGTPLAIHWTDANARKDERDTFYNTNFVHAKVKEIDPAFTGTDYAMVATVGRTDGFCPGNAWWDGSGINFCDPSATYGNTGEIGNVVYHEYGHGVTDFLYGAMDPPGDLHEGNSDILACYLDDVSIVGLGFFVGNCTGGIRDLDNALRYPDDLSGEGHFDGQIIGGFHWDMRENLRASLGQPAADELAWDLWHFGRKLGLPQTQPDQVMDVFIADDDNGDLTDGTPHYHDLCLAANAHGFDAPPVLIVMIAHAALRTTTGTPAPLPVQADIASAEAPVDPDQVFVYWSADGGPANQLPMTSAGGDSYEATIPAQPMRTEVSYYIYAANQLGSSTNHPPMAACGTELAFHSFDIAYAYDDVETDTGWSLVAPGDNATTGRWERDNPEGTAAQPEDDHTGDPGVICFVTDGESGGSLGAFDVDSGTTTLTSPVFDVSGGSNVAIKYFRWYTNDTGATPGTDSWVVDLSNDSGTSWVNIENTMVSDHSWRAMQFETSDYFATPDQLRVRFKASDLGAGSLVEAGVDDFTIFADFGATSVEVAGSQAGVPDRYVLHAASPNPFNPKTTIRYGLPAAGRVTLSIFDVEGRVVRSLVNTTQAAGNYALVWDGADGAGRRVASGVYFYRLDAGAFSQTQKLVMAK